MQRPISPDPPSIEDLTDDEAESDLWGPDDHGMFTCRVCLYTYDGKIPCDHNPDKPWTTIPQWAFKDMINSKK